MKLVKRKKYNKIILISNVGKNLGGKHFVEEARKIQEEYDELCKLYKLTVVVTKVKIK